MSSEPEAQTSCPRCEGEVPASAQFCIHCGVPLTFSSDDPLVGTVIADRYLLKEKLGEGAAGTIYLAQHLTLKRRLVVKILHESLTRDDLAVERFRREAIMVGELDNEHIVRVTDFGRTDDGRLFLTMEHLEGETLATRLRRGALPVETAVSLLRQLGDALGEAHALGYVHRDLRPRNLFLVNRRGKELLKLLDFGLAKLVERDGEADATSLGLTFGDPRYMSPEQSRGAPVDRRSDLYSVGVIAFEMLAGRPPFFGNQAELVKHHLHSEPLPPSSYRSEVPGWLDTLVLCALAKAPEERFLTADRLVEEIDSGEKTGRVDPVRARSEPGGVGRAAGEGGGAGAGEGESAGESEGESEGAGAGESGGAGAGESEGESAGAGEGESAGAGAGAGEGEGGGEASRATGLVRAPSEGGGSLSGRWYADGEYMDEHGESGERQAPVTSVYDDWPSQAHGTSGRKTWLLVLGATAGVAVLLVLWAVLAGGDAEDAGVDAVAVVSGGRTETDAEAEVGAEAVTEAAKGEVVAKPEALRETTQEPVEVSPGQGAVPRVAPEPAREVETEEVPVAEPVVRTEEPEPAVVGPEPAVVGPEPVVVEEAEPGLVEEPEPAVDPGSPEGQANALVQEGQRALGAGNVEEAEEHFTRARELDLRNAMAIAGFGQIAMARLRYQDALVHLEAAQRLAPESTRIGLLIGEAYLGLEDRRKARRAFERVLEIDPTSDAARRGIARAGSM